MTLALAESIAEKKSLDLKDIAKKQLEAYKLCIQPDGHVKGGFGTTTRLAFNNLRTGKSPLESGIIGGPGNAPAMKMSPLGLYMDATNSYEKGIQFSNLISRITHLDHRSIASGAVQSHCIYTLLRNPTKENFLDSLEKVSQTNETLDKSTQEIKLPSLTSKLEWINNNRDASEKQAFQELGNSGRVYESYPFALFMFQKYWENPLQGLIETVNYGGDCDTTGAIYGALCGSKNGMIFPKNLLNIQNLDKITKAAVRIYELKK